MTFNPLFISDYQNNFFPSKHYKRVVSLVPSLTDVLFSFGLDEAIIGVTKYCTYPVYAQDLPRIVVGGTKNPNIKQIIDLNPDIVLVNQEENQLKHYSMLKDAHIPVFVTFPKSVPEALKLFDDLRILFAISKHDGLDRLNQLANEIQQKVSLFKAKSENRIFCPIWKKPWMSINGSTFASSMIEFCGGINIFKDLKDRYPEISIEEVIEKKPNLILLPNEPYNFTEQDKEELHHLLSPKTPIIKLIDGTFHWYSIDRMLHALPVLFNICNELI